MSSVEVWALDQIKLVMNSAERLSSTIQNNDSLLDILFYCKTTPNRELEENFRSLLQCYLQLPPGRWGYLGNDTQTQTWGTITLAHLYQHPTLKQQDPALFGHVFCVVLSAGRQSIIWEALTRETRLKLLAAQVYLTPLPSTLPISWISKPAEITLSLDAKTQPSCFYSCRGDFDSAIKDAFDSALYSKLSADSPLAGVTSLSKLAVYRQMIAQRFKRSAAKHTCKCRAQLLSAFDAKMNTLFTELAEKYHEHWD
ncbi:hypothetical protein FRC09_011475 [Ceratobasidium sp. 395]|nr:hypothetical protein FRC09_011475 [Ceratobasidium sp. 395]